MEAGRKRGQATSRCCAVDANNITPHWNNSATSVFAGLTFRSWRALTALTEENRLDSSIQAKVGISVPVTATRAAISADTTMYLTSLQ
jgi:hypothetical protein